MPRPIRYGTDNKTPESIIIKNSITINNFRSLPKYFQSLSIVRLKFFGLTIGTIDLDPLLFPMLGPPDKIAILYILLIKL